MWFRRLEAQSWRVFPSIGLLVVVAVYFSWFVSRSEAFRSLLFGLDEISVAVICGVVFSAGLLALNTMLVFVRRRSPMLKAFALGGTFTWLAVLHFLYSFEYYSHLRYCAATGETWGLWLIRALNKLVRLFDCAHPLGAYTAPDFIFWSFGVMSFVFAGWFFFAHPFDPPKFLERDTVRALADGSSSQPPLVILCDASLYRQVAFGIADHARGYLLWSKYGSPVESSDMVELTRLNLLRRKKSRSLCEAILPRGFLLNHLGAYRLPEDSEFAWRSCPKARLVVFRNQAEVERFKECLARVHDASRRFRDLTPEDRRAYEFVRATRSRGGKLFYSCEVLIRQAIVGIVNFDMGYVVAVPLLAEQPSDTEGVVFHSPFGMGLYPTRGGENKLKMTIYPRGINEDALADDLGSIKSEIVAHKKFVTEAVSPDPSKELIFEDLDYLLKRLVHDGSEVARSRR